MDTPEPSHRRAVWATIAVVLLIVVGLVGYELNWIRQRRALHAEFETAGEIFVSNYSDFKGKISGSAAQSVEVLSPDVGFADLPPLGSNFPQRLLSWLGEPAAHQNTVYCLIADSAPHGEFMADGTPVVSYVEKIPKIIYARELFPEVGIDVILVKRGLLVPSTGRWDPALERAISP
jgi:hypothetical protein